jgi:hypothetical protein
MPILKGIKKKEEKGNWFQEVQNPTGKKIFFFPGMGI